MPSRFTRDTGADLWTYLEALSREGVRCFPDTAARDAEFTAPVAGMRCYVGARTVGPPATDTLWEYYHDGTGWQVLMSPWQAITVNAGGGFAGSNSPSVRMMGGLVTFKGTIGGAMASTTTTYTLGTVPAGFRPPSLDGRSVKAGSDVSSGAGFPFMCVAVDGSILVRTAVVTGTPQASLGGLSGYSVIA